MINTHKYNGETWIDIDHGTPEEVKTIMDTYKIHPFVARELGDTTRKPRVEFHENYIYCILHFPAWKHSHSGNPNQEMDFIVGKDLLITARYDNIDSLHKFSKSLEVEEALNKHNNKSSHSIFVSMLRELYNGISEELNNLEDMIDDTTDQIFKGNEKQMVISISKLIGTLLDFKRMTDLHKDVLEALHHHGENIFGKNFAHDIESVTLEYLKIQANIRNNLDALKELRETNNSLLTTKQNEVMRRLTVISFVIFPLNLIAWIFAMRTNGMPIVDNPNAFWIVIVIMIVTSSITMIYSKHKKWI